VTLPYAVEIADRGLKAEVARVASLAPGVNTLGGSVVYSPVAEAHGMPLVDLTEVLV
jgi:alanine dehydrogenase